MAHLANLNPEQLAAVTAAADVVQVLAPPGSGKTKTLTSRVAYLLGDRGFIPWNVICLTFTIKSAREMKERVAKLIGEEIGNKVILGTFHSVCRRYLSYYGHFIGLRKGFGIADTSDTTGIVTRIIKRDKLTIEPKRARSKISSCKAKNIGWEQLQRDAASKNPGLDQHEFVTVYQAYEEYLETSNLLDYDDLLLRCLKLLRERPECVNNVQAVLVDEFQDTNTVQFELMNLFAQQCKHITTVGDPDQSIYGWRNAEITNLTKMQTLWPETLVINLEQNYRSAGRILRTAQKLIEQDSSRPQKQLVPVHRNGKAPVFRLIPTAAIEAEWIVAEIARFRALSAGMIHYSDFSILLRTAALSRQIESAFGKHGIPYHMVGGVKFFDRAEVKILLDYLRVIAQPENSDALARIINVPSRHIGEATVKALLEEAMEQKCTMWKLLTRAAKGSRIKTKLNAPQLTGLGSLVNVILTCQKKLADSDAFATPRTLLEQVAKMLKFSEYLQGKYKEDHEIRLENVAELFAQADDVLYGADASQNPEDALPEIEDVDQEPPSGAAEALARFLANVTLSTEKQTEDKVDAEGRVNNKVTISTIHAAKGLEWPIVFIPACYQGNIPHSRAEDSDEERRLLYVAMTRAQAMLYLSRPIRSSTGEETTLSCFIDSPKVGDRLEPQGHMLEYQVFEDIASILGRECPDRQKLADAIRSCQLEHILDDRWPLDGQHEPTENKMLWDVQQADFGYKTASLGQKRRKVSEQDAASTAQSEVRTMLYANSTMDNASQFTVPSQAMGFMSAAQQMEIQAGRAAVINASSSPKDEIHESKDAAKTTKTVKPRATKRESGQSSLKSFFGGGQTKNEENPQSFHKPITMTASKRPREKTVSTPPTLPSASRPPMAISSASAMNRTMRPSSSFNPLRKPLPNTVNTEKSAIQNVILTSDLPPPEELSEAANVESVARPATGNMIKAAVTTHSTTVSRLAGGTQVIGPRRLGTRGPMAPWNARGKGPVRPGGFGGR